MSRKVLIVAAHADDEVLGCGATIVEHIADGDDVQVLFMTDGVSSRNADKLQIRHRERAKKTALEVLGVRSSNQLNFPDNAMDTVPLIEVVKSIEAILREIKPNVIYTHFHGDLNIDHRVCFEAVLTATRPTPEMSVKEIYGFEVLSSTEWQFKPSSSFFPQLYVDVTNSFEHKQSALEAYQDEMRISPHSRSFEHVESLGRHRGLSVGVKYAEAFMVYRILK